MFTATKSPYTKNPQRLADVIAAIQAMGIYEFHMCSFARWARNISGDEAQATHWRTVFEEHPEFFRLDTERKLASLVWRRQLPKWFHVDRWKELSEDEYVDLSSVE